MFASTHQSLETLSAKELYDRLLVAAKEKNLDQMTALLNYVAIDMTVPQEDTVACKLVLESTNEANEALQFLLTHFPEARCSLMADMILGSILKGDMRQAKRLYAEAKNPLEQFRFQEAMMEGAAATKNIAKVSTTLAQAINGQQWLLLLSFRISGHARIGDEDGLKNTLALTANNAQEKFELSEIAVESYSAYGYLTLANTILEEAIKTATPQQQTILRGKILSGLIKGGHPEAWDMLLDAKPDEAFELKKIATNIYAFVGDENHVKNILNSENHSIEQKCHLAKKAINGYACGGHLGKLKKLLRELCKVTENPFNTNQQFNFLCTAAYSLGESGSTGIEYLLEFTRSRNARLRLLTRFVSQCISVNFTLAKDTLLKTNGSELIALLDEMALKLNEYLIVDRPFMKNILGIDIKNRDEIAKFIHRSIAPLPLFMLAEFSPQYQETLGLNMQNANVEMKMDINDFIFRATHLHTLTTSASHLAEPNLTQPVNRFRCKNWIQTQQFLHMTGPQLVKKNKLTVDTFLRIAAFLGGISSSEAFFLSNTFFADSRNKFFHTNRSKAFYDNLAKEDRLLALEANENDPPPAKRVKRG